jgi:hypothetical protein
VRANHDPRGGRGGECGAAKRRRRSGLNWTGAFASMERKRSAGGGGRPIRMAPQQTERVAELHPVRRGVAHRRGDQARRSYKKLRGCADRVSAAHAREQRRLSP